MAEAYCEKCCRSMNEDNFYTYKDGSKTELCKKCLTMHIDNFDPSTFLWLLEKMDVPYIEAEWNVLRDKAFAKNPMKMNGMSVFGKYLSKMKLNQWNKYSWADTEKLKQESLEKMRTKQANQDAAAQRAQMLKVQLDAGEITPAQYQTLVSTEILNKDLGISPTAIPNFDSGFAGMSPALATVGGGVAVVPNLPDPAADLTDDDKVYLAMKWGRTYQVGEWVELERHYNEMTNSFDIQDADTTSTLVLICKT